MLSVDASIALKLNRAIKFNKNALSLLKDSLGCTFLIIFLSSSFLDHPGREEGWDYSQHVARIMDALPSPAAALPKGDK